MFMSHLMQALLGHSVHLTSDADVARSQCVHLTSEQEALSMLGHSVFTLHLVEAFAGHSVFIFMSGADIANAGSVCSLYTWFRHCYITVCLVSGASIVRWSPTG